MVVKLNLIAAVCDNLGIGCQGQLPWKLDNEMAYFNRMTSITKDPLKRNVMIMGRLTWESFPQVPDDRRICIVLSKSGVKIENLEHVFVYPNLESAIDGLENDEKLKNVFESVWIIGGSRVYKESLDCVHFHRLYLTTIFKQYNCCDTFFPTLPPNLKKVEDPRVPTEMQEEGGTRYIFNVFEKM